LADGIPEKEILMAYISRSCDFPKVKMGRWVAYIIRSCDQITKKGNIDGLCKQIYGFKNSEKSQKNSENYCKIQIKSNKPRII
jgi:hypothetical protein